MKSQESVKKTRLGDILLEKGLITTEQLQYAINVQKTSQLPIGEILIQNKWISHWQINRALKTQSKLRNAIFTSLLSLSPLALVGCGSAGQASPESTPSVEQVINATKINSDDGLDSISSDEQNQLITVPISNLPTENLPSTDENEFVLVVDDTDPVVEEPLVQEETEVVDELQLEEQPGAEEELLVQEETGAEDELQIEEETLIQEEVSELASVQLSWMYPDKRMDGSDFHVYEVQSFRIYQLSAEGGIDTVYEVDGSDTGYIIENLVKGEYFFAITVLDTDGLESNFSEAISVPIS